MPLKVLAPILLALGALALMLAPRRPTFAVPLDTARFTPGPPHGAHMPPLDLEPVSRTETATFALG
jgi:hypothetical protein